MVSKAKARALNHELDAVSVLPVSTTCGLDLGRCFELARTRGDGFTLRLDGLSSRIEEDACPGCVRAHVEGILSAVQHDAAVLLRRFRATGKGRARGRRAAR